MAAARGGKASKLFGSILRGDDEGHTDENERSKHKHVTRNAPKLFLLHDAMFQHDAAHGYVDMEMYNELLDAEVRLFLLHDTMFQHDAAHGWIIFAIRIRARAHTFHLLYSFNFFTSQWNDYVFTIR